MSHKVVRALQAAGRENFGYFWVEAQLESYRQLVIYPRYIQLYSTIFDYI